MSISNRAKLVWQNHGEEIYFARNNGVKIATGYGIKALCRRFSIGYRTAKKLVELIDEHGPDYRDGLLHLPSPTRIEPSEIPDDVDRLQGRVELTVKGNEAHCSGGVKTLAELLKVAGVDSDSWKVVSWQARTWDANVGDGVIQTMHYVKAQLEPKLGTQLHGVKHLNAPTFIPAQPRTDGVEKVVLLPDTQIGYRRKRADGREWLDPIHDRRAMDLAWSICERVQPDVVVMLGDMIDLAEMSTKYPRPQDLINTSQPAILETAWWCRRLRETCPDARIIFVEGNHESRLARLVVEKAGSVEGLRGANDSLDALSVERLLGLAELNIEYLGPYGADQWLWADSSHPVRIHHGSIVRPKGGQTVSAQLSKYHQSIIGGHVHRVEVAWATDHGPDGQSLRFALTPGCLCRTDGAVPGNTTRPDWQQGFGWIYRDLGSDKVFASVQTIVDGSTVWNGEMIHGQDLKGLIATDLEWSELDTPD